MQLERTVADIDQKLRDGRFPNEQSISQGIVLRILSDLGWDVYDTNVVWPEFSTGEGRVDFALCAPPAKPKCFVEVKQQGKAEDGVKQALEYAFHTGAQFVTLTDGQTWSFYLPPSKVATKIGVFSSWICSSERKRSQPKSYGVILTGRKSLQDKRSTRLVRSIGIRTGGRLHRRQFLQRGTNSSIGETSCSLNYLQMPWSPSREFDQMKKMY